MDSQLDDDVHINHVLWHHAWHAAPVHLAHTNLLNELLKHGFVCDVIDRPTWRQFVSDFVFEILVYGYCVFRSTGGNPQIASGRGVEIERQSASRPWTPRSIPSLDEPPLKGTRGWKVVVHHAPMVTATGQYSKPTSGVFKALGAIIQHRTLIDNMMQRDRMNSAPGVFTTISNSIGANQSTSRPWFNQVHNSMVPGQVTGRVDFRALVQHRSETIEGLRQITETARQRTRGPQNEPVDPEHVEHIITDGRDMRESRHLQQDNEIVHYVTERTGFQIMQILGVPPQALGQNINSERLASSNRLTEMSIQHYRVTCACFKELVEIAFEVGEFDVKFGTCISLSTVHAIEQIAKPASLRRMFACALDVPESDISLDRIRAVQAGGPKPERAPRRIPTEEEKDENRKRKAE